ncbi:MAG: hypothetical protein AB7J40_00905 [Candidatus Altimarinota bacterium]
MNEAIVWGYDSLNNAVMRTSISDLPQFVDTILHEQNDAAKFLLLLSLSRRITGHTLIQKILLPDEQIENAYILSVLNPLREKVLKAVSGIIQVPMA